MKDDESQLQTLARLSGHGLTLALSTGLFLLAGWWVDGKLGTTPLFTILGAMTGAGAGFYSLLQHLIFFPRAEAEAREQEGMEGESGSDDLKAGPGEGAPGMAPGPEGGRRGSGAQDDDDPGSGTPPRGDTPPGEGRDR